MDKINQKNKINIQKKILLLLIFLSTIFMSIGYATINSISLNINGLAKSTKQEGIFITDYKYVSDINADLENSKIENIYQTTMRSKIVLSETDNNASITYEITIYNSTDYNYIFEEAIYDIGNGTYDNENIKFYLTNLSEGTILNSKNKVTFTITFYYDTITNISNNILNSYINFKFSIAPYVVEEYSYTGDYETFTVPHDGIYKIELWGASGGNEETTSIIAETSTGEMTKRQITFEGGYGGYTSGEISLIKGKQLYIYVGEMGKRNLKPTFNGGGTGAIGGTGYNGSNLSGDSTQSGYSGGGATDVRLVNETWDNFDSLKSRIMVAAGGGGSTVTTYSSGGGKSYAGGITGYSGGYYPLHTYVGQEGQGGNQIAGGNAATIHFNATGTTTSGIFGIGGNTTSISSQTGAGGGGGGYYGGGSASGTLAGGSGQGGGGGSSFISGHTGCNAVLESSTKNNIVHTGQSIHYSDYKFINTKIIDGGGYIWTTQKDSYTEMPTYDGTSTMIGNIGNGYAKITFLKDNE